LNLREFSMGSNNMWRELRSIGTRALTGGLMVLAAQTPVAFGQRQGDEPSASVQHTTWNQGVVAAEIAWLANPTTFHENLTAALAGDYLEIRGSISSEATRMVAMRLAREASRMPVVDHMESASAPAPASPDRPLNSIYKDAVQALYHGVPQLSRGLTISTLDRGEVVVRGEVPTLDDKLAVSRCLKLVAGCNCVRNQVRTRVTSSAPSTIATVSKAPVQDNSLLARLGLVQPRTEVPYSSPAWTQTSPSRATALPKSAKPELVALPTNATNTPPPQVRSESMPDFVPPISAESWRENKVAKTAPIVEPIILTSANIMSEAGKLRMAIAETCGVAETKLRVVAGADKTLTVTLSVPDVETGTRLAAKILAMPELVPYGVSLDVSIAR
jgi:hypothetical protein